MITPPLRGRSPAERSDSGREGGEATNRGDELVTPLPNPPPQGTLKGGGSALSAR
jgi:hypothetical protein